MMPVIDGRPARNDWKMQIYCRDLERTFHQIERVCYEHNAELWDLWREPSSSRTNVPSIDDEHGIIKIFTRNGDEFTTIPDFPSIPGDLYVRFRFAAQNFARDFFPYFESHPQSSYRTEIPEYLYLRYTQDRIVNNPLGATHLNMNMQTFIRSQWVTYASMDGRPPQQVLRITGWEIRGVQWFTRAVIGVKYSKYERRLRWINSDEFADIHEVNYDHVRSPVHQEEEECEREASANDTSSHCGIY